MGPIRMNTTVATTTMMPNNRGNERLNCYLIVRVLMNKVLTSEEDQKLKQKAKQVILDCVRENRQQQQQEQEPSTSDDVCNNNNISKLSKMICYRLKKVVGHTNWFKAQRRVDSLMMQQRQRQQQRQLLVFVASSTKQTLIKKKQQFHHYRRRQ